MRILVCKSATFGGANYLIDRFYMWLIKNCIFTEQAILSESVWPSGKHWDLAVLPSYVMNDVYKLKLHGYTIERIFLWVMGSGCFQDGYYNPIHTRGIKGFFTRIIHRESEKALLKIKKEKCICFTDVVGRYNTFRDELYCNEEYENDNLIPTAVAVPKKYLPKRGETIRACWLGRVAFDFKYIPLRKVLYDFEEYVNKYGIKMRFTIVGNGDALDSIKEISEGLSYEVCLEDFIPYDALGEFFHEQDIAFAMGTSALDAARNGCASVIVTPVRPDIDVSDMHYRWIFESKGYALGEYPGLDVKTKQVRKSFEQIMKEFETDLSINSECYEYTKKFDEDVAFKKLLDRDWSSVIDWKMWRHIRRYYYLKKILQIYSNIVALNKYKEHE